MLLRSILFFVAVAVTAACARDSADTPSPSPSSAPASAPAPAVAEPAAVLTQIQDPSLVCMINDTYMGKAQIPVEVGGKTYFGCCAMCKERLANEPEARVAVDPVTGESVDKATAVLAKDADGKVLYFASAQSLRNYRREP